MKKKYIAALLLGSSFFMLSGFDSKLTPQEILETSAEAVDNIGELNSIDGNIQCRMRTDVSFSSKDDSKDAYIPAVSTAVLNNISGNFTILDDSSVGVDMKWKIVVPGEQDTLSLRFYRFLGRDGFQNYFYNSVEDEWIKTVFPEEIDEQLMDAIQYGFSTFIGENTGLFLPEGKLEAEDLLAYLPQEMYSEQEIEKLEDIYEQFFTVMQIKADRVTVSPLPTEIDGAVCYKLEQNVSYDIEGLADLLEQFCMDRNEASSAEASEELCEEEMADLYMICDLAEELIDDISIKKTCYIDDTTFMPVKETMDMSGWDFSSFFQKLAEWSVEDEMYGLDSEQDAAIPKIGISMPEYKVEISYQLNEADEIKIPVAALSAGEIETETKMESEMESELE